MTPAHPEVEARHASPLLPVYRFRSLDQCAVSHGITARSAMLAAAGDVSYVTGPCREVVRRNREIWSASIGVDASRWTCAQQVHGTRVAIVDEADAGRGADSFDDAIEGTDALITATPGIPLAVFCADCVPILLHDPVRGVVVAVHSGWRGTVRGVIGETVRTLRTRLGTDPADLVASIGPSIGPCCYGVGHEVIEAWRATRLDRDGLAVREDRGRRWFDLWTANRLALVAAGVREAHIEQAGICTRCHADDYFSHRAARGTSGRFAAIIALNGPGVRSLHGDD